MRFQFGIKSILLATCIIAIACGGVASWIGLTPAKISWGSALILASYYAPMWLPVVFVAYAIGRRSLTVPIVIALAVTEAVSIGYIYWMKNHT
jgi:hypothetical protein